MILKICNVFNSNCSIVRFRLACTFLLVCFLIFLSSFNDNKSASSVSVSVSLVLIAFLPIFYCYPDTQLLVSMYTGVSLQCPQEFLISYSSAILKRTTAKSSLCLNQHPVLKLSVSFIIRTCFVEVKEEVCYSLYYQNTIVLTPNGLAWIDTYPANIEINCQELFQHLLQPKDMIYRISSSSKSSLTFAYYFMCASG